jgi:hypothetical protein
MRHRRGRHAVATLYGSGRPERNTPGARANRLFDQFEQRAAALAVRRFRIVRSSRRLVLRRHHRIAQRLQFRVRDSIEFHPQLKDSHGHQLGGFPIGAVDENCPALLKRRENLSQSFFRISHQHFFRHRAREVKFIRSNWLLFQKIPPQIPDISKTARQTGIKARLPDPPGIPVKIQSPMPANKTPNLPAKPRTRQGCGLPQILPSLAGGKNSVCIQRWRGACHRRNAIRSVIARTVDEVGVFREVVRCGSFRLRGHSAGK